MEISFKTSDKQYLLGSSWENLFVKTFFNILAHGFLWFLTIIPYRWTVAIGLVWFVRVQRRTGPAWDISATG